MVPTGWHTELIMRETGETSAKSATRQIPPRERREMCDRRDSKFEAWKSENLESVPFAPVPPVARFSRRFRASRLSRAGIRTMLFGLLVVGMASTVQADGETLAFAVVSEAPKDKARVSAKVSINDAVSDMKLLASETILNNLIWKKLEICHAMKLHGFKAAEGFQVVSVHVIDAGMLPMSLQSFAGDCLIKKAIEIAPLVD